AACPPSLSSTGWVPARSSLLYRFPALSSPGRVPARVGDRPDRYPEPSLSGIGPHPGQAVTFSHPGGYPQRSSRAIGDVGAKSGRDHMFSHTCARPTEMTPMRRLRAACLAALMVATGALVAVATASPAQAAPVICEKFGSTSIQNGTYIVQNNVWGADTTQCIDVNQSGGFTVTQADHNKATNGAPAAYPSIFSGCHWTNCSTGSNMPIQVNQISSATSSISVSYPGSGTWNAAYDIWLDPTPRTDGQNGAELMIWLNRQGSIQPIGSPVGNVNIAGRNWEVWYGNTGWHVISYVSSSPITSLNFSVLSFINDVISRGYINNSWYLTSIQAGFEPWVGGAGLAVNSFSAAV